MSTVQLKAADGHMLSAYVVAPSGLPRGAVVVIQEIFGVNSHIRSVSEGYAKDGYLAVAPALFDRVTPGYDTGYEQADVQKGMELVGKLQWDDVMKDVAAAVAHASTGGKVGVVGFCYGGTVAWVAAARVAGLAAGVGYYGGFIPNFIGEQPKVPVLLHFGERDQHPSPDAARKVLAAHPDVTGYFYNAGHGFNCDHRASFDAVAAQLARSRTLEFLRTHVG